ncbi:sialidase family protein [Niabella beijingensis]|uniref:sialidase family protein n=1 Tax=Niabella beijingensis TaxID=2872700 RepID=UPI001CC044F2|nr:sialidase family protein [Niabella beijingensis]MBZ4192448.1 glycoside hydrolase [Niabella beijingensis]
MNLRLAGNGLLVLVLLCSIRARAGKQHPAKDRNLPAYTKPIRIFSADKEGYNSYRIPCMARAKNGNLIAFAEGRKYSVLDYGDIDLVYKISHDNGQSWSKLKVVISDGEGTWGNPAAVTDEQTGRIWLFLSWNDERHSQHGGRFNGMEFMPVNTWGQRRLFVTCSDDNGITWTRPVDYTGTLVPPDYTWDAVGPGIGIQIVQGKYKGRLIIPAGRRNIYSDDHGTTWKYRRIPPGTFEGTVTELSNGQLMRNDRGVGARWSGSHTRFISRGTLEQGFAAFADDPDLPDPRCQAAVLRYAFSPNLLLFLNPAQHEKDGTANRCLMTVRLSEDDGDSWKYARLLYPEVNVDSLCNGYGGYSSMIRTADGFIGALTEFNHNVKKVPVADKRFSIDFHRFNLEWVRTGKDQPWHTAIRRNTKNKGTYL